MIVDFRLDELKRTLKAEFEYFEYVDVKVEKCIGRLYAVITPPKAFEPIIPSETIGDLKVFLREGVDDVFGVSLEKLVEFIEEVVECGRKLNKKCENLVVALRELSERGGKDEQ